MNYEFTETLYQLQNWRGGPAMGVQVPLCPFLRLIRPIDSSLDLIAYTWGRDKGEPVQEVGGVVVTPAAMCHAVGLDMAAAGETELARINTPGTMDKIRRKHQAKTSRTPHSALPGDLDGFCHPTPEKEPSIEIEPRHKF